MFESISPAPPDAILGLTEAFRADPNPAKINLGVGVFMDDRGHTPVLESVRKAEAVLLERQNTKSYLPIAGSPAYALGVQDLLFGASHPVLAAKRVQTAQTPGGTGGLRVGADFLKRFRPDATVWMSNPTWANHKGVFNAAGFPTRDYPYYHTLTHGLDFEHLTDALSKIPAGDIVLLHVCCHNPTGVDPSPTQWAALADIAAARGWFAFFDFAYQGFGESVEADRLPLTLFAERGLEFAVAASCSKNFGLYNERTGSFSIVGASADAVEAAFSHVKIAIRCNYSNPPRHGGAVVETILGDAPLRNLWMTELQAMRNRIFSLRGALVQGLLSRGVSRDFSFIARQKGMFSFSGLDDAQVRRLRDEYSIYMVGGGRINIAGISAQNLDPLCDAIAAIL